METGLGFHPLNSLPEVSLLYLGQLGAICFAQKRIKGLAMSNQDIASFLKQQAGKEPFANLLGLKVIRIGTGYAKVQMQVDEKKLNIHGITHGGSLFGLVDEAFELASNSHGTVAVALNMNITFFAPTAVEDTLFAEAHEIKKTRKTATYQIDVTNQAGELVSRCQALVYRKSAPLPGLDGANRET
ncbi:MAG: thioesterase [Deltaproteobacteria bacterium]|nr:MAG: thioesterase [Deltaproteobacteria bacterium]